MRKRACVCEESNNNKIANSGELAFATTVVYQRFMFGGSIDPEAISSSSGGHTF
jgi:hypothetical protein